MEGGESLESFFGFSADQFSATKGPLLLLLDPFLSPLRIGLGGGSAFNGIGSGERGIGVGICKGRGFRVFFARFGLRKSEKKVWKWSCQVGG